MYSKSLYREGTNQSPTAHLTLGKDYKDMVNEHGINSAEYAKGRGQDFRHKVRFHKLSKARDFEDLHVVALGLRHVFRKTKLAKEEL